MAAFDNTNTGIISKNEKKASDRHPDYTGSINIRGEEFWVSGWIRTSGANSRNPGSKFMSLAVSEKTGAPKGQSSNPKVDEWDDDIPF